MTDIELSVRGVYLGRQGESGQLRVYQDVSEWISTYGSGSGVLMFTSPSGEQWPLETEMDWEHSRMYGTINATETAESGNGCIEARWMSGENQAISDTYNAYVFPSEMAGEIPEDGVPEWVKELILGFEAATDVITGAQHAADTANEALDGVETAVQSAADAAQSAEDAEDSAEDAEDSAVDAEAWAKGTRGGTDVESTDETYHNNAKYYAEQAGDAAADAAADAAEDVRDELAEYVTQTTDNKNAAANSAASAAVSAQSAFSGTPEGYDELVYDVGKIAGTDGVVTYAGWEAGGMVDATGVEYASNSVVRSGFIPLGYGESLYIKSSLDNVNPQIFEFAGNTTTTSDNNVRLSKRAWKFGCWYTPPKSTINYIRVLINGTLSDIKGLVTIVKEDSVFTNTEDIELVTDEIEALAKDGHGYLHGKFSIGNLSSGAPDMPNIARVFSWNKFVFDRDVTLTPDTGFRFGIHFFGTTGETFTEDSGWQTEAYTIPAGTYFRIVINETALASNTLADITRNVKAVKVSTALSDLNGSAVRHAAQSLTTAQKTQARTNIGAVSAADVTEQTENLVEKIGTLAGAGGTVEDPGWEAGGMFDATGKEYASTTVARTGFIPVKYGERIYIVSDLTEVNPQIFEFAANTTTTDDSNVRLHKQAWKFGWCFTPSEATVNYIRITVNGSLSDIKAAVYIQKNDCVYANLVKNELTADEIAELEATGCGYLHGVFTNGNLSSGQPDMPNRPRVFSWNLIRYDRDVTLTPDDGYRFGIHSFGTSGEAYVGDSGWQTSAYTIPAGTYFKIVINQTSASSSTVADIPTYIKAVKVSTAVNALQNEMPAITCRVSGDEAVFFDGANDLPLEALILRVQPVQSGSGDPSGTNRRPITGRASLTLHRSGYDITDPTDTVITLPATLYGGTVNVLTGEVTEEYTSFEINGSSSVTTIAVQGTDRIRFWTSKSDVDFTAGGYLSDMLKSGVSYDSMPAYSWGWTSSYPHSVYICLPYGGEDGVQGSTAADIKAWLTSNPIQAVAKLTTAATSSADKTTVRTLKGENHFWTGDGTIEELEYRADAALYGKRHRKSPWLVQMHRGYVTDTVPDNTIQAFYRAHLMGADAVEMDAQLASDGVYVLWHDTTVTVGGTTYTIAETASTVLTSLVLATDSTYGEIRMTTLEAVLKMCAYTGMLAMIDCKAIVPASLVNLVAVCGMSGKVVYFNTSTTNAATIMNLDSRAGFGFQNRVMSTWNAVLTDVEVRKRSIVWTYTYDMTDEVMQQIKAKGYKALIAYPYGVTTLENMNCIPDLVEFKETVDGVEMTRSFINRQRFF